MGIDADQVLARLDQLDRRVGTGTLEGRVTVDQVYAKYQHEREDLRHPRGGIAKYLWLAMLKNSQSTYRPVAEAFLAGSVRINDAMLRAMQRVNRDVGTLAPVRFNVLRRSGAPAVYSGGRRVRYIPPAMRRLSEAELRAIRRRGRQI